MKEGWVDGGRVDGGIPGNRRATESGPHRHEDHSEGSRSQPQIKWVVESAEEDE